MSEKPKGQALVLAPDARIAMPPAAAERYGLTPDAWTTLVNAIFPTAKTAAGVMLAMDYCRARRLDVMKRPVHVVPMRVKEGGQWVEKETVWPGIGELRTTAHRTGRYAGSDPCALGPMLDFTFKVPTYNNRNDDNVPMEDRTAPPAQEKTIQVPEWAQVTVYRIVEGMRVAFPGPRVYWRETYATKGKSDAPNEMWEERPIGQIQKCAEAAALRAAFPEEVTDYIPEEMERQANRPMVDITPTDPPAPRPERAPEPAPKPTPEPIEIGPDYETLEADAKRAAAGGVAALKAFWDGLSKGEQRHLAAENRMVSLKAVAAQVDEAAKPKPTPAPEPAPEPAPQEQDTSAVPEGTREWLAKQMDEIETITTLEDLDTVSGEVASLLVKDSALAKQWEESVNIRRRAIKRASGAK